MYGGTYTTYYLRHLQYLDLQYLYRLQYNMYIYTYKPCCKLYPHAVLDQQFVGFCEKEFNDSQFSIEKGLPQDDNRTRAIMEKSAEPRRGHCEITLPWKVFTPDLPNNKIVAAKRIELLKKRLLKDQKLHRKYSISIVDLFEKGNAQKVPEDQREGYPHGIYLIIPSFIQKSSINRGCDLTNSSTGVLTRFSTQPIAIMADIEKMFYQLRLPYTNKGKQVSPLPVVAEW